MKDTKEAAKLISPGERISPAGAVVAALAILAWLGGQSLPAAPAAIDPPAPPGSTLPALAIEGPTTFNREPEILMTWLEPGGPRGRLRFARLSGGTWSPPVTIAEQVSAADPSDPPSLAVIETHGTRRTLIARAGDTLAQSGDGGRSWTRLPAPLLRHASLAGGEEGAFAFWLGPGEDGSAKLLGARVLAGETLLDPRVPAGAALSAAMTWDGPVVVYHHRSSAGEPELAIIRRQDARWTASHSLLSGEWRPAGDGLQVAAQRRQVAVGWVAGTPQGPRVAVAFSSDAGRTFGAPVALDANTAPAGPVAVDLDDDGHALVLWTAGTSLRLARVSPDGRQGAALVLTGEASAPMGAPQLARAGGQVAVAWVAGGRVRAVAIPLAGVPPLPSRTASSGTSVGRGQVGDSVPDLELVSLQGEKVSLASLRGRPVLLNLWATWCLPCVEEMPELAALAKRHRAEGLVVVGVSVDAEDRIESVRKFIAGRKIPFTVWLDPGMRVPNALRVQSLPATFVIDREGRIVLRRDVQIEAGDREIEAALRRALSQESETPR